MSEDFGSLVYLALLLMLVGSSLLARRLPFGQMVRMLVAWIAIFGAVFVLFTFRSDFGRLWDRVRAEVSPGAMIAQDGTVRIRKAADGHFWVDADVNGKAVRFMVDSGATTTSLSAVAARSAGVEDSIAGFPVIVSTANGLAEMQRARLRVLRIGGIERRAFPVLVSEALGDTNLLGMNFLSSLTGWRIEGDILILNP